MMYWASFALLFKGCNWGRGTLGSSLDLRDRWGCLHGIESRDLCQDGKN